MSTVKRAWSMDEKISILNAAKNVGVVEGGGTQGIMPHLFNPKQVTPEQLKKTF